MRHAAARNNPSGLVFGRLTPVQAVSHSRNSIVTSLTIGVAVFPDHAIDAVSLVGAADEAMYRAKQAQRGTRQVARLPQPHTHP